MSLPHPPDHSALEVPDSPDPQEGKRRARVRRPALTPREQIVRAEMVMAKRLTRQPIVEVMEDLGISRATYYRALSMARKQELYGEAKDFLLSDLLPRALRVYAIALEANDVEVARDIINGLGLLGKTVTLNAPPGEGGESVTYERWRMQRGGGPPANQAVHPPGPEGAVAGDYLDVTPEPLALPEGAAQAGAGDDPGGVAGEGLLDRVDPDGDLP